MEAEADILQRKIPGSGTVEFDAFRRSPVLEMKPDRDALRRYNMQEDDLNHAATARAGEEVGSVIEGNRRLPILVHIRLCPYCTTAQRAWEIVGLREQMEAKQPLLWQ